MKTPLKTLDQGLLSGVRKCSLLQRDANAGMEAAGCLTASGTW